MSDEWLVTPVSLCVTGHFRLSLVTCHLSSTMARTLVLSIVVGVASLALVSPAYAQKFLRKDIAGWVNDLGSEANEATRRTAAFALGKMGSFAAAAVPALKRTLEKDASPKVREAAAFALGEIARESIKAAADPELVPLLSKSLNDAAWQVRRSAAFALGCLERDAGAAQEPLEAALRDAFPEVRQNAAWALGRVGPPAIPKLREALGDGDPFVKRDAAQALNLFEPEPLRVALPDLLKLCQDSNAEVRRATVVVLIRILGPEDAKLASAPLQAVLSDADEEIRRNAALALGNIGGKEAAPAVTVLVDALRRGDIELRRQAAAALRNIGPGAVTAVPDLTKVLKDEDRELRTNAALALGGIGAGAEKAVPALVALLADVKEHQEPRMAAAVALSHIGLVPAAIDAVPRLTQLIADPRDDGQVRWRAAWALRVHKFELRKMDSVFPALAKVLKEPKTEDNRMLRYDCAYLLGVLQSKDAANEVVDVLAEFLKDESVKIYDTTQATVQGSGQETGVGKATVKELGKGDGRVMATQALRQIGVARLKQRPDIIQQLQALARDQMTFAELRKDCAALLKEMGR
jgi:HEAT repeat protein